VIVKISSPCGRPRCVAGALRPAPPDARIDLTRNVAPWRRACRGSTRHRGPRGDLAGRKNPAANMAYQVRRSRPAALRALCSTKAEPAASIDQDVSRGAAVSATSLPDNSVWEVIEDVAATGGRGLGAPQDMSARIEQVCAASSDSPRSQPARRP
jgi:hypothetical protein